jgi:hypothetical protein
VIERNQPCPCGSGKKYKKCCGAAAAAVQVPARDRTPGAERPRTPPTSTPAAKLSATASGPDAAAAASDAPAAQARRPASVGDGEGRFLVTTGRGVDSERTDAERRKHLRRRIQDKELRGTLVYNSGAFFKPPAR